MAHQIFRALYLYKVYVLCRLSLAFLGFPSFSGITMPTVAVRSLQVKWVVWHSETKALLLLSFNQELVLSPPSRPIYTNAYICRIWLVDKWLMQLCRIARLQGWMSFLFVCNLTFNKLKGVSFYMSWLNLHLEPWDGLLAQCYQVPLPCWVVFLSSHERLPVQIPHLYMLKEKRMMS